MIDFAYPESNTYYVTDGVERYPVRQGDLLTPSPQFQERLGKKWHALAVVHPSCEIITTKAQTIQVCRVLRLESQSANLRPLIVQGTQTDEAGEPRIAMSHTFYFPALASGDLVEEPLLADFRQVTSIPSAEASRDYRLAALTHEARVCFIQRSLYWRQRWYLSLSQVQELEKDRISHDYEFEGPRPEWAPVADQHH